MKPHGYIYLIINLQNHKSYCGKTIAQDVYKYIEGHFRNAYKNIDNGTKHFYNAIRKYGKQNFKYIVLGECCSEDELNEAEKTVIYHYRLFSTYQNGKQHDGIYGYNLTEGGEGISGWHHTNETKQEISKRHKGRKHSEIAKHNMSIGGKGRMPWNKGKHMSDEAKHNMSIAQKGRVPWNKGLKGCQQHSDESKRKIAIAASIANKGRKFSEEVRSHMNKKHIGKKLSEETKQKMSKSRMGQTPWNKGKKHSEETKIKMRKSHSIKKNKEA